MNAGDREFWNRFRQGGFGIALAYGSLFACANGDLLLRNGLGLIRGTIMAGILLGISFLGGILYATTPFRMVRQLQSKELGKRIWALGLMKLHVCDRQHLGELNALESTVEQAIRWSPPPSTAENAHAIPGLADQVALRLEAANAMQAIAERKAQLTRWGEGELLAGETIKVPTRRRGYAVIRMQVGGSRCGV